jgi:hypothetical protein
MGSGFRTFTAGEVLTASNVQNYLQDQVVMTFAGSAARSSAIGTANFEEGMVSYLTDTDKVEAYNGTNWVQVGSSNQGLTLINTTSFSGVSSVSLPANTFTATYDNYYIILNFAVSGALDVRWRGRTSGTDNSSATYDYGTWYSDTTGGGFQNAAGGNITYGYITDQGNAASTSSLININNPFATKPTTLSASSWVNTDATTYQKYAFGAFNSTTSFDSISFITSANNFTGTASVYGFNK